ncbi:zinc-finger domain-containing protein [Roseospira visakhapatnamensis]|uniref:Putative Zn-finger protein n=1 Tax=Roseospira visakhapatnamensis TaxID=390880 RepID=A0A7W6R9Q2_9PROT|nr:zinc-finger domain-containing protein [Roseospira visakhapatnamensis]MBB4264472.1 putative Zn-finger protein [Roseospira visakhapatnamensis]
MEHVPTFPVTETVVVDSPAVVCDGIGVTLGHPRVYLHIKPGQDSVICPYCSRQFALTTKAALANAH